MLEFSWPTKSSASARAWSISPNCCCAALELLTRDERLREHYQHRFGYILVDEFQDTNDLQYEWLKLLAGQARAAVRGRRRRPIDLRFPRGRGRQHGLIRARIRGVARSSGWSRTIARTAISSTPPTPLIATTRGGWARSCGPRPGQGELVRMYEAGTDGRGRAGSSKRCAPSTGKACDLSDIALLYRSNAQSRVLEQALFNAGLPYRVYGGLRFFERLEVKHALAYLRSGDQGRR